MSNYNISKQLSISSLRLFRDLKSSESDKIDITPMLMELLVFEDIFSPTVTARLTLVDILNLPDSFPLMGGEIIDFRVEVPGKTGSSLIQFVIASVSDRVMESDNTQTMAYTLELVTADRWLDSQITVSSHFSGRYDQIVTSLLSKHLKTKKTIKVDPGHVNQIYICPNWSPLRACVAIRDRVVGSKYEPFLFYEDLEGYNFKNISTIYKQKPYCEFHMGMGSGSSSLVNPDLAYRRVNQFEMLADRQRLLQESKNSFGSKYMLLDTSTKRFVSGKVDYTESSAAKEFATIDQFPTYDSSVKQRNKFEFLLARNDMSHEGSTYSTMSRGTMGNTRVKIAVPGDIGLHVGSIVLMDVYDKSLREAKKESFTSGRWLVTGLKHCFTRTTFYSQLELMKDSHQIDASIKIKGKKNETTKHGGVRSPSRPTQSDNINTI